ncbi:hypothetical protein HD806DRAFT_527808 [Xylariaceae sp. AK1471]|nr:hypothetical protein HD806DRAFT_527808 [Xylariaceae sp. AK1471]
MSITKLFNKSGGKSTGWKRAAKVNSVTLIIASAILVGCSIAAVTSNGLNAIFFLSGDCDSMLVSGVNLALHLLINIVSTLVVSRFRHARLASSNFFMQVVNAPSRAEVDDAHSRGSWLGIGVPSVRNAFLVSKFKTWCWVSLFISSIPIHILFNSTIFETDYRSSDFHLTIATEDFLHGGPYFPPGASLLLPGQVIHGLHDPYVTGYYEDFGSVTGKKTDYDTPTSPTLYNISRAAAHASTWTRIEVEECWEIYHRCHGVKKYRDLVEVINQPSGWIRRDIWHLSENQSRSWDQYVPAGEPNHLLFDSQCAIQRGPGLQPNALQLSIKYCLAEPVESNCHVALSPTLLLTVTACIIIKTFTAIIITGVLSRRNQAPLVTLGDAVASFIEKPDQVTAGFCTIDQRSIKKPMRSKDIVLIGPCRWQAPRNRRLGAVPQSIWISSYLLFFVGISIQVYYFVKVNPQVSNDLYSGNSFLQSDENPFIDTNPFTLTPFSLTQATLLANSPQLLLSFCYLAYNYLFTRIHMAKEWAMLSVSYSPLRVTDPQGEQFTTYRLQLPYKYSLFLMAISIGLHWLLSNTIYIFISIGGYYWYSVTSTLDASLPPNTSVTVGYSVLSLLTLMVVSVALIFVPIVLSLKRLPANSINVGSNSLALSAACHASRLLHDTKNEAGIPVDVVEPPSPHSQILLPPQSEIPRGGDGEEDGGFESRMNDNTTTAEMQAMMGLKSSGSNLFPNSLISEQASSEVELGREQMGRSLRKLAQSKIRWGVIKMPPEWYIEYAGNGPVEHIGFGSEEDMVSSPVSGHFYA